MFNSAAHDAQFYRTQKLQTESEKLQISQSAKIDEILQELKAVERQVNFQMQAQGLDSMGFIDHVNSLTQRFAKLRISQTVLDREQSILKSLDFSARRVRHRTIPEAHQKTFRWVYQQSGDNSEAAKLGHWLANSNGIFWTSGKPGSGKSTFMKFVADNERTRTLISQWAAPKPAAISSHYFWTAGTAL